MHALVGGPCAHVDIRGVPASSWLIMLVSVFLSSFVATSLIFSAQTVSSPSKIK